MPSTLNLRPCPFCGGSATLAPMRNAQEWWRVRCNNYHCGVTPWAMPDAEQAVNAWNRRPDDEA
ncbi:Lar family restriction alleviation protein [Collimonas sp. OK242]|uniref:Lar family restriction alleviation protein n=1 Tax=Collimonas sp. OK242 TaxID=1798195 RepID=UPI0015A202D2